MFYIVFQCVGAIIGAGILYAIALGTPNFSLAANGLGQNVMHFSEAIHLLSVFIAEIVFTFIFVLVTRFNP